MTSNLQYIKRKKSGITNVSVKFRLYAYLIVRYVKENFGGAT